MLFKRRYPCENGTDWVPISSRNWSSPNYDFLWDPIAISTSSTVFKIESSKEDWDIGGREDLPVVAKSVWRGDGSIDRSVGESNWEWSRQLCTPGDASLPRIRPPKSSNWSVIEEFEYKLSIAYFRQFSRHYCVLYLVAASLLRVEGF